MSVQSLTDFIRGVEVRASIDVPPAALRDRVERAAHETKATSVLSPGPGSPRALVRYESLLGELGHDVWSANQEVYSRLTTSTLHRVGQFFVVLVAVVITLALGVLLALVLTKHEASVPTTVSIALVVFAAAFLVVPPVIQLIHRAWLRYWLSRKQRAFVALLQRELEPESPYRDLRVADLGMVETEREEREEREPEAQRRAER